MTAGTRSFLVPAAEVPHVSDDVTLFGIEVDEALVRRVLAALPGVQPLPPGEETGEAGSVAEDADASSGEGGSGRRESGPTESYAGAGSPAPDESGAGSPPSGAPEDSRVGRGGYADTPWPGGTEESTESGDGGGGGRNWKKIGIYAGLVLGLGLLGVGAVLGYRKWQARGDDESGDGGTNPMDAAARAMGDDARSEAAASDDPGEAPGADEERSPRMDVAPIVGISFLAAATIVVRRVYADEPASIAEAL